MIKLSVETFLNYIRIEQNGWLCRFIQKMIEEMKTATTDKTPAVKRAVRAKDTKLAQGIIARLDKFFGTVPYRTEWAKARNGRLGVIVSYTDFLSEHLVEQMMSDFIPKEVRVVLKREYSDDAIARLLLQEYKKNRAAIVDCYGGELRPQSIREYVNGRLDKVEMLS